jgi:hypothetical protein
MQEQGHEADPAAISLRISALRLQGCLAGKGEVTESLPFLGPWAGHDVSPGRHFGTQEFTRRGRRLVCCPPKGSFVGVGFTAAGCELASRAL